VRRFFWGGWWLYGEAEKEQEGRREGGERKRESRREGGSDMRRDDTDDNGPHKYWGCRAPVDQCLHRQRLCADTDTICISLPMSVQALV
jgi:hypothetical protein